MFNEVTDQNAVDTALAFDSPRQGDLFHEMYSFWMVILHVSKKRIIVMEGNILPESGKVRIFESDAEFRKTYRYETIPSYWVRLSKRGLNVEGWL